MDNSIDFLPEEIECPYCNTVLELEEERKTGKITCPGCNKIIDKTNLSEEQMQRVVLSQKTSSKFSQPKHETRYRRYLKPFEFDDPTYKKEYKNGFAIMANCCLLIETIESFYRGWARSRNELNFLKFFTREIRFKEFSTDDIPSQFYKHIRCGILHQGETTGGWTINRKNSILLDKANREINAVLFAERLKKSLEAYTKELKTNEWNAQVWKNTREKMKVIIKNCK